MRSKMSPKCIQNDISKRVLKESQGELWRSPKESSGGVPRRALERIESPGELWRIPYDRRTLEECPEDILSRGILTEYPEETKGVEESQRYNTPFPLLNSLGDQRSK